MRGNLCEQMCRRSWEVAMRTHAPVAQSPARPTPRRRTFWLEWRTIHDRAKKLVASGTRGSFGVVIRRHRIRSSSLTMLQELNRVAFGVLQGRDRYGVIVRGVLDELDPGGLQS